VFSLPPCIASALQPERMPAPGPRQQPPLPPLPSTMLQLARLELTPTLAKCALALPMPRGPLQAAVIRYVQVRACALARVRVYTYMYVRVCEGRWLGPPVVFAFSLLG
jgi:hypothetical protein